MKYYNNQNIRRQDRLLEESRAEELLKSGEYGILSMVTPEGEGYGIPLNYVWDEDLNSIYIHCAPEGKKLKCIAQNPNVSFPDFVNAYPKIHQQTMERYVDAVS